MTLARRLLALILTLAVILSGAGSAVARSEMASAVYPVICGEFGAAEAQAFDPTGKPLPQRHACPHCLGAGALSAALVAPALAWSAFAARAGTLSQVEPAGLPVPVRRDQPEARGPPPRI